MRWLEGTCHLEHCTGEAMLLSPVTWQSHTGLFVTLVPLLVMQHSEAIKGSANTHLRKQF